MPMCLPNSCSSLTLLRHAYRVRRGELSSRGTLRDLSFRIKTTRVYFFARLKQILLFGEEQRFGQPSKQYFLSTVFIYPRTAVMIALGSTRSHTLTLCSVLPPTRPRIQASTYSMQLDRGGVGVLVHNSPDCFSFKYGS